MEPILFSTFSCSSIFPQPTDEIILKAKTLQRIFLNKINTMPKLEWDIESEPARQRQNLTGQLYQMYGFHCKSYYISYVVDKVCSLFQLNVAELFIVAFIAAAICCYLVLMSRNFFFLLLMQRFQRSHPISLFMRERWYVLQMRYNNSSNHQDWISTNKINNK